MRIDNIDVSDLEQYRICSACIGEMHPKAKVLKMAMTGRAPIASSPGRSTPSLKSL